ncbi:MAG TPA: serine/threonine-protein kinase, partial [Polyangiales bacterium]|nr:serine/threonine-protein kinase [Polyangiales bacterium]
MALLIHVMSKNPAKTGLFCSRRQLALQPNMVLGGKYRLDSLIGEGGMGSVWRACNLALDMPVALKVLRPEVRGTDGVTRLLREARLEARLQHPGIVRVFDYGETPDKCPYIVMELLQGSNLADLAARHGSFTPNAAVSLLMPALAALRAAHRAGIVHRDLKPENIFLAHAGSHWQPKLLDFGIARLGEASGRVTLDGALLGSPAYMAPEQARGLADVDARADVWSMCVVLYELIRGEPAFDADDHFAMLRAVIKQTLPPLRGDAASLWPILQRGLAKDRDVRFAN